MELILSQFKVNATVTEGTSYDGDLQRVGQNQFDLGAYQASFSWQRSQWADYLPYISTYDFCLKSIEAPEVASYETLFLPFDQWTWMLIAIVSALVTLSLVLFDLIFSGYLPHYAVFENVSMSFSSLIQESVPHIYFNRTSYEAKRILLLVWLMLALLLALAYKSNLLAILAIKRYDFSIEGPHDVLKHNLTFYLPLGTYPYSLIKDSPVPIIREVYQTSVVGYSIINITETIKEDQRARRAVSLGLKLNGKYYLDPNDPLQYHFGKDTFGMTSPSSFVISKNSWWKVQISYLVLGMFLKVVYLQEPLQDFILKIRPMGLYHKMLENVAMQSQKNRMNLYPGSKKTNRSKIQQININMVMPIFMFMIFGTIISLIALGLEFLFGKCIRVRNKTSMYGSYFKAQN